MPFDGEVIDFLGTDIASQYGGAVCRNTQPLIRILVYDRTETLQTRNRLKCSIRQTNAQDFWIVPPVIR